jgi:hypothetical protein
MSPSLIISIVAVIISATAVGVSVWTHIRSHKLQKRIVALEEARERDRLTDKRKAYLVAKIVKEELARSGDSRIFRTYHLVVENKGLAEARNIVLLLADTPVLKNSAVINSQTEVKQIGPQSSFRYEFEKGFMKNLPLKVDITWEDDSGEPGKYSTTLTL